MNSTSSTASISSSSEENKFPSVRIITVEEARNSPPNQQQQPRSPCRVEQYPLHLRRWCCGCCCTAITFIAAITLGSLMWTIGDSRCEGDLFEKDDADCIIEGLGIVVTVITGGTALAGLCLGSLIFAITTTVMSIFLLSHY